MGCDIHLHTEIKVGGKWLCYGSPSISRNYHMFAKMADVRNYDDIKEISHPKGLPEDISEVVKLHYKSWESDAHSESWLNVDEIIQLEEFLKEKATKFNTFYYPEKEWGYLFGNPFGSFKKFRDDYPIEIKDVRFVFWFDN